jgi:hypothetical protein
MCVCCDMSRLAPVSSGLCSNKGQPPQHPGGVLEVLGGEERHDSAHQVSM